MLGTVQAQGAIWGDLVWVAGGAIALVVMVWQASRGFSDVQTSIALLSQKVDTLQATVDRLQTIVDGQLELMAEDRARTVETIGGLERKIDALHARQDGQDRRLSILEQVLPPGAGGSRVGPLP